MSLIPQWLREAWDRTPVATEDQDPDYHWWEGPTTCPICEWAGRSVVEIPIEDDRPVVALECPECGHMGMHILGNDEG
jgi:hypothetical protein